MLQRGIVEDIQTEIRVMKLQHPVNLHTTGAHNEIPNCTSNAHHGDPWYLCTGYRGRFHGCTQNHHSISSAAPVYHNMVNSELSGVASWGAFQISPRRVWRGVWYYACVDCCLKLAEPVGISPLPLLLSLNPSPS